MKRNKKKMHKYQQRAYEIKKRRPGCHVEIISVVIECMEGGANRFREQIAEMLETFKKKIKWSRRKMLKTVLAESEI